MQNTDRLSRTDAEEDFDGPAVERGGGDGVELGESGVESVDPLGAARHGASITRLRPEPLAIFANWVI